MADNEQKSPAALSSGGQRLLYILVAAFAAILGFAVAAIVLQVTRPAPDQFVPGPQIEASAEKPISGISKLVKVTPPRPLPEIAFDDADGRPRDLSEWKGKIVLINLWATWCAPCKQEMPSLGRLQAKLGGADFAVVAINLDRGGPDAPRKFLAANNLSQLGLYLDKSNRLFQTLLVPGLPLSVLVDREGREIARLAGAAEWDGPEAEALIRSVIAGNSS